MFFRKRQPETAADKLVRVLGVKRELVATTRSMIADMKRSGQLQLALENYGHLIGDLSGIAIMLWRQGEDPRPAIAETHAAYGEMLAFRDMIDAGHAMRIGGITDWDLVYTLFWFIGRTEDVRFAFPHLLDERYFAYSHYVLHRVTGATISEELAAAVNDFTTSHHDLVDRHFRDLLMLLGDIPAGEQVDAIVARAVASWPKRRRNGFFNTSAPLQAGWDASNDLSVDYQLAAVIRMRGLACPPCPHLWLWD